MVDRVGDDHSDEAEKGYAQDRRLGVILWVIVLGLFAALYLSREVETMSECRENSSYLEGSHPLMSGIASGPPAPFSNHTAQRDL